MEHEQANNSRVEEQTPKKSFSGPVTGGDNLLQKALPSNPDQTVPLQPLGVNATPSSHANNREGRRNSSESGNRSEETTAKVWAKNTKGWMLCLLVDVAMFSASLGLSLAAALVKPHKLALFIAGPLVAALAVLWSVFRLYDLLKPSALASEEEYAERQSVLSTTWTKETIGDWGCVVAPGVGRGSKRGAPRNLIDATIRHATMPDTTHLAKILS
ncbi:hypothetical protein LQV05_003199 [Cryptococcus neoformans]|nr:hypothetical protein LQV05_003199 [Cryptococcus neoformans]